MALHAAPSPAAGVGRPVTAETLRLEMAVTRGEEAAFVERVRLQVSRIHLAVTAERPDIVVQSAGELAVLADRRLRQLGGER